ncbi:cytochrome c peroxidase [Seonamhaeicola sp.]|uniref:cytochrome-c peroxidase n=1 Tax=Seonamhaeicola sp. TaxID=1912245 RepID=UPI0026039EA2|nr:cytochrome c peroxidase [Seonamhaeicola sp.]
MKVLKVLKLKKTHYVLVCLFAIIVCSCKKNKTHTAETLPIEQLESFYQNNLKVCIAYLDTIMQSDNKLRHYIKARDHFKKMEPILAFADSENYKALNQPNILKIEEEDATDIKRLKPFGFQVIEELLHEDDLSNDELQNVVTKTKSRLEFIQKNPHLSKIQNYHMLWLIRDEIARIALTGITGFDSPVLERSLTEAAIAYKTIQNILIIHRPNFTSNDLFNAWNKEISATIQNLDSDFNTFDRFSFIKDHTHRQLELILETKNDWNAAFPYELAFSNDMTSLFSENTFNMSYFSYEKFDTLPAEKVKLGEALFYDTSLSKENTISCATCHLAEQYFTDGKPIATGVTRNSPTLLYAALQQGFFYDNRAGSLEGQIVAVVTNENEFHSDLNHLETVVSESSEYISAFSKLYKDSISQNNIRNAIATYIRSLTPFNSKFDRNINGLENTLTASEKNGFNLFTGKAKCATCHFPPTFNGTVPVAYKESEMELIGVPETKDTIHAVIDDDLGRYHLFNAEEKKHFFKTTTVRNAEKTGPYMHNGVFNTLEEVIDFYDRGGGIGLGMDLEYQTLPPDKLNLSENEKTDLVSFMKSLTDALSY